ncbi:hypothetical protein [uncultured Hyphomicrobium sp.]|uniref:hypothetical protein n=1 Tax=uncultured Hyphomicrobium sp. TaxID=194373 RepID=UPI0025F2E196|nr:hypothetical protein [uncultured Hyphomicrobium sp.]
MGSFFKALLLGFVAGVIAFVTVHELVSLWLLNSGFATRVPWSADQSALSGYPQGLTDALWGGVWGAIFGLILGQPPNGSMTLRGALLGIVGPAVIGALVAVPLLHGQQPFLDLDVNVIWPVVLAAAVFGAAAAWLYGLFSYGRLP